MPGRTFQAANTSAYRFGFNDKENDRGGSWSSTQLVQDYGARLYNPAIGKFLSVDPIAAKYPMLTPYQFASNAPITSIDLDGLEAYAVYDKRIGTINIVPNVSKTNPELPYRFVSAFDYIKLTDIDRKEFNYGIEVKNVFTGGHYDQELGALVQGNLTQPNERPISTGTYNILENKGNTAPTHNSFFVLDPVDESPYDKTDDRPGEINSRGDKRTGYNFHPGGVSWGCVTVCKYDKTLTLEQRQQEWDIINDAIEQTKTELVPDNRGKHKYIPFEKQVKFGTLEVIESKEPVKGTIPRKKGPKSN